MPVLLIRLAAPLQSWGASSRFTRRETEPMPTKSGVIGMIAAALGIGREESLERFAGLRFGVRIDQPGTVMRDFHTAEDLKNERPGGKRQMLPLSIRYYLQDAVFLVGLESPDGDELERYRSALAAPHYQLFLGRRSCPPDGPIRTWISQEPLEDALRHMPWCAAEWYQRKALRDASLFPERCFAQIIVEPLADETGKDGTGFVDAINDEPVSFDPRGRRWQARRVKRLAEGMRPAPTVKTSPVPPTNQGAGSVEPAGTDPIASSDDIIFNTIANATEEQS
ncbi:type I-E CRISPR-associated protein Cas5/CasD [Bifidobacterium amazonense]|uniref:Type I-E CRISPR-associated protein Cas5/CasD n=1 Tax=Bifidobacterium amazonense TaxID=2809027 RepID=A0ABS9VVT2_9BIFI|nr:type I-E CRISPR-associated protein Cas5/CasD [Bifidobacterium amazonense]MCH9276189.1 type I-E CRISPR-associated protein Cas5/CasD [Bifidobacterium amazonense]